jgi:hypothetical protein
VLSVAVAVHADGSVAVACQTFARTVVGDVPSTCTRTRTDWPPVALTPGTVRSAAIAVSAHPEVSRERLTDTAPVGVRRTFAWYCPAAVRRPATPR